MEYIEAQLEDHYAGDDDLAVLKTGSHAGFLTYDGIDVNGKRVADEITAEIARLGSEKHRVAKLSIVGYLLGGLIARYACGVLRYSGVFATVAPVNFVTFCLPHVGVLHPGGGGFTTRLYEWAAPRLLAHLGAHIFLGDRAELGDPLLVWMANPQLVFYHALAAFRHRALYSNVVNDKRTCWYTLAILVHDPFQLINNNNVSRFVFEYVEGYAPTVIDIAKPVVVAPPAAPPKGALAEAAAEVAPGAWPHRLVWLRFIVSVIILTPLWGCYFVLTSVLERVKLNRRLERFYLDASNSLHHLYAVADEAVTFADETIDHDDADDDAGDDAGDGAGNDAGDDGAALDLAPTTSAASDIALLRYRCHMTISEQTDGLLELAFDAMSEPPADRGVVAAELDLTPPQRAIVANLNALEWRKFPVIIRHTKATHAAAIVKVNDPAYAEGKTVVRHFVTEVFKSE
jgi:hypothetical protein